MSTDKYAQFISGQQKKLSVSGTNPVDLNEGKTGDWNKGIKKAEKNAAKHLTPKAKEARDAAHALGDDDGWYTHREIHGDKGISKEDWKKGIRPGMKKEEVENLDEWGNTKAAIKGTHAPQAGHRAPPVTPGKVRFKGHPTKPKVQTDLGLKQEDYALTTEEVQYIEELTAKGKLNGILMHHKDAMRHHEKMSADHADMADRAEDMGDREGFEHHFSKSVEHEHEARHHEARYNHAQGLKDRANAQRELKAASAAMKKAHERIANAKADKQEY